MFESVVSAPVVAAVAVDAANSVPGVRVQPGFTDLVGSVARIARQRVKGLDPAPTEGVRVRFVDDAGTTIEVDVATSGQDQAAVTARLVQQAVASAVSDATGLDVTSVLVSILDIDVPRLAT
ncbi:Asp23/Gls24 family envelope stress response protein [Kibdelosporangium aridum]|uniref:Uncharacterized conserved protein YloU, alkaline shock protein (Asp23) family n=1 Tax=Kibdelosporangium aridum TaxID=2030 RepID=A0A1W2FVP9_KIBAR|nr:Uncharacterized conserved protein YloU, alkaline shock protein (Asp23) family [Kibdelosporangium aridum]